MIKKHLKEKSNLSIESFDYSKKCCKNNEINPKIINNNLSFSNKPSNKGLEYKLKINWMTSLYFS